MEKVESNTQGAITEIVISEEDLSQSDRKLLELSKDGDQLLGDEKSLLSETIFRTVLRKVRSSIPNNYELNEINLKISLSGSIVGTKLGGEVSLKLRPRDDVGG